MMQGPGPRGLCKLLHSAQLCNCLQGHTPEKSEDSNLIHLIVKGFEIRKAARRPPIARSYSVRKRGRARNIIRDR